MERAIRAAQAAGVTPGEVLADCETYEANRGLFAGPGALRWKIDNGSWPVEGVRSADEIEASKSDAEAERLERWLESQYVSKRRSGEWRQELAALEAHRGATLDAMDARGRDAIAERLGKYARQRIAEDPADSFHRYLLLSELFRVRESVR